MSRSVVAAATAGLVAGLLGSVIANAWLNKRQPPQTVAYVPTVGAKESAAAQPAMAALALAAATQRQQPGASPPPTAAQPLPPGSEPEMRMLRDALAQHAREPENPAWAARVKRGLDADLEKVSAEAGITRFELKCRSKTCAGIIEWPSPLAAHRSMPGLLHKQYTINSAVRLGLPDRVTDGPYRVEVIFVPAPGT